MTPTRRIHLKLFALAAIPFGLIMIPFQALATLVSEHLSIGYVIGSSAASGLLYGAWMSWLLGGRHVRAIEALVGTVTDETLSPRQTKVLHSDLTPSAAYERCLRSIRAIRRARIVAEDPATGTIEARAGATMRSWGEIITVRVRPGTSDTSTVEVTSRPSFTPTVVDYGANLEHVMAVENSVRHPVSPASI